MTGQHTDQGFGPPEAEDDEGGPLCAGYLLMAALDGELTPEKSAGIEDRLVAADPIVRLEWEWLQRIQTASASLALAPVAEDRFAAFLAGVEARISDDALKVVDVEHLPAQLREPAPSAPPPSPSILPPRVRTLRPHPPEGHSLSLDAFGMTQPCDEGGGDFFDLRAHEDGLHVALGDASGRGAEALSASDTCKAYLRAFAHTGQAPAQAMTQANAFLVGDLNQGQFVSALLLRWDEASQRLSWCGAGHEHLIHYRAATAEALAIKSGGVVLGITTKAAVAYHEHVLALEPGDRLVLFSDGLTENPRFFPVEELTPWVAEHGALQAEPLTKRLIQHSRDLGDGRPPQDDVTVVVLARNPGEAG